MVKHTQTIKLQPSTVILETFNQKLKSFIKHTFSWTGRLAIALLEDPWRHCFLKSLNITKPVYPQICVSISVILFAQKNEEKLSSSSTFHQKLQQASSNCVVFKISLSLKKVPQVKQATKKETFRPFSLTMLLIKSVKNYRQESTY